MMREIWWASRERSNDEAAHAAGVLRSCRRRIPRLIWALQNGYGIATTAIFKPRVADEPSLAEGKARRVMHE